MAVALLLFLFMIQSISSALDFVPYEKLLTEHLFKDYNVMVRPSNDSNAPLSISIHMHLEAITEVNDKEGTITVAGWVEMMWTDCYLCWDPADFGNTSQIIISAENIWRPDLAFNTAIGERFFNGDNVPASIGSSCLVAFAPGGRSTHSCDLDMTLFPFDTQTCKFVVLSWYSSSSRIAFNDNGSFFSYDETQPNEIWSILGTDTSIGVYDSNQAMEVTFSLRIRRKPLYYMLYVIVPLIMLAVLNLMVFRLPPDSGEKISLSITVLLAFSIWLMMLNDITPSSSETIPILGVFITGLMAFSAMSTIMTVHVVRMHFYEQTIPIPQWAKKLMQFYGGGASVKVTRSSNQVKVEAPAIENEPVLTWRAVSAAVDRFSFLISSLLTIIMIVISLLFFVSLKR